jgi:hypothetical protein
MPILWARLWYLLTVAMIPWIDRYLEASGMGLEERARRAHQTRTFARTSARSVLDPEIRELLRTRDTKKYGNPEGPTFEQLFNEAKGDSGSDDDVFARLIASAGRSDSSTDETLLGSEIKGTISHFIKELATLLMRKTLPKGSSGSPPPGGKANEKERS